MHPAWRYHRTQPALIVTSEAADAALSGDWANTPAAWHNVAADCCDPARAEHGRRHAADCAWPEREPEPSEPKPSKKKKNQ